MSETLEEYKQRIASTGGVAVRNKYGKKHFQELQKRAVASRKAKKTAQS